MIGRIWTEKKTFPTSKRHFQQYQTQLVHKANANVTLTLFGSRPTTLSPHLCLVLLCESERHRLPSLSLSPILFLPLFVLVLWLFCSCGFLGNQVIVGPHYVLAGKKTPVAPRGEHPQNHKPLVQLPVTSFPFAPRFPLDGAGELLFMARGGGGVFKALCGGEGPVPASHGRGKGTVVPSALLASSNTSSHHTNRSHLSSTLAQRILDPAQPILVSNLRLPLWSPT